MNAIDIIEWVESCVEKLVKIQVQGNHNYVLQGISNSTVNLNAGISESDLEKIMHIINPKQVFSILIISSSPKDWNPYFGSDDIYKLLEEYISLFVQKIVTYSFTEETIEGYFDNNGTFKKKKMRDFVKKIDQKAIIIVDANICNSHHYHLFQDIIACLETLSQSKDYQLLFAIPMCEYGTLNKQLKINVKKLFHSILFDLFFDSFDEKIIDFEPFIISKEFLYRRISNFVIERLNIELKSNGLNEEAAEDVSKMTNS